MYLKQLVLKGFKSFADRSTLDLEPGITAIVGPNGSGKSNISDAVLWVLGERNAKNLRGQVMEDVIFAGSTARKSVNVAEVTLVLDNSDGMLPVDFNEVAISRRMYRSGESEYLINNTIARRMDVLDILHDSGLGTGTHSIISQGHLDSILASKPEDRRALIEEAAGVLKHKQRKAKSKRKLEQMDNHLARVNDVVREVERQLGPLQRKARRAQQHAKVSEELHDVRLSLAVDDLRKMQREWNELLDDERAASEVLEVKREALASAQAEYDKIQEAIQNESGDVARLVQKQSRAQSILERLESRALFISEKRKSLVGRCEELSAMLEQNSDKTRLVQEQREGAQARLDEIREKLDNANTESQKAQSEFSAASDARARAERDLRDSSRVRNELQRNIERVRSDLSSAQEKLAGALGRVQAAQGLTQDFDARVVEAQSALDVARERFEKCEVAVALAKDENEKREIDVQQARKEESEAQRELNNAMQLEASLTSRIQALEEAARVAASQASPARTYVLEHADESCGVLEALSNVISVDAGYEQLVESLLGEDALALIARGGDEVCAVDELLCGLDEPGNLSLLMSDVAGAIGEMTSTNATLSAVLTVDNCEPLISKVHASEKYAGVIEALLGDVYVCKTLKDALFARDEVARVQRDAHKYEQTFRFATMDGSVVYSNGKVRLVGGGEAQSEGVGGAKSGVINASDQNSKNGSNSDARNTQPTGQIASEAQIKECKQFLEVIENSMLGLREILDTARDAFTWAQEAALQAKQEMATLTGELAAAKNEKAAAEDRLGKAKTAQVESVRGIQEAQDIVDTTRPHVDALNNKLEALTSEYENARDKVREAQNVLDPARAAEQAAQSKLSDAKLRASTLQQQLTYELHVVEQHSKELVNLAKSDENALSQLQEKQCVRRRAEPLLEALQALTEGAQSVHRKLSENVKIAQEASMGAHTQADKARDAQRAAQEVLNVQNEEISKIRENKARMEVQVQAAVNVIAEDLDTTMEDALELPEVEDRGALEAQAAKLARRIKNMGTINPDAAREYEELKERYDYLMSQLSDLSSARASLKKIDKVIEIRMKDDFRNTFETVNKFFQEIFSDLFPGGSASLSLVDPEDIENSGVEVSAQPRGKRITKMSLMSGGEKSLVALALLFAVYKTRATPFYILDEVEAALDDSNLVRLMNYLEALRENTQLIMITHQRRTMETANVLFGVSMQADGITRVISQRLDHALQYAE